MPSYIILYIISFQQLFRQTISHAIFLPMYQIKSIYVNESDTTISTTWSNKWMSIIIIFIRTRKVHKYKYTKCAMK